MVPDPEPDEENQDTSQANDSRVRPTCIENLTTLTQILPLMKDRTNDTINHNEVDTRIRANLVDPPTLNKKS